MHIGNTFTFGHLARTEGPTNARPKCSTKFYQGSTNTESLAIGQQVSDSVQTSVEETKIEDGFELTIISDLDGTPNLNVGFTKLGDTNYLSVTNRSGEFETQTSIPVNLKDSELENAQNLDAGFQVGAVRVLQLDPEGNTVFRFSDATGMGTRMYAVTGGLQDFEKMGPT